MTTPSNGAPKTPAAEAVAKIAEGKTGQAALEASITKLFADDAEPPAGVEGHAPTAKPETTKQPEGDKKPDGETVDLSHDGKAETDAELAERAKERGVTVEQQQADEAMEQSRLDAITAKTGETADQIYEREEKEGKPTELETAGKPAKTFTQEEVNGFVQKRVKNLEAENADLKRQLTEKPASPAEAGALSDVSDPSKLAAVAEEAQQGLDYTEGLLNKLAYAPQRVEREMWELARNNPQVAAKFRTPEGEEDFSAERIADVLESGKSNLKSKLKAVPQRQAFLAERAKIAQLLQQPELVEAADFLGDPDSEEHAEFQQYLRHPAVRNEPRGEFLAVALALGLRQLKPAIAKLVARNNGGKAPAGRTAEKPVKLRLKSAMPGTSRGGGAAKPKAAFAAAKAKGDASAMAEALDL